MAGPHSTGDRGHTRRHLLPPHVGPESVKRGVLGWWKRSRALRSGDVSLHRLSRPVAFVHPQLLSAFPPDLC